MDHSAAFNKNLLDVRRSSTLRITSLAGKLKAEGRDVINFAAGEPDFDTPDFVKESACRALEKGFTKYTPSTGLSQLKEAVAEKFNEENGIKCLPGGVIVTPGAKFAVFLAIASLLNRDEEVLIPSPYWVSYPEMARIAGASVKIIETNRENGFKIDPEKLKKSLTPRSKLLILNYPANPTGTTYNKQELERIWQVVRDSGVFVLSDEIYEKLIYDKSEHVSFASLDGAGEKTVTVNGFSKSFSMTGWRLGFLTGPLKFIENATKVVDHTVSCPNSFSQYAAVSALREGKNWMRSLTGIFEERRNAMYEGLISCPLLDPFKPSGTFYNFCGIDKTGLKSLDFCSRLLYDKSVAIIPSAGFGIEGYIRCSFAVDKSKIEEGIDRIKDFLSGI